MDELSIDLDKLLDDLEIVLKKNRFLEQENTKLKKSLQLMWFKSEKFLKDLAVVPNKIVFVSYDGNGYGCNPKYIAEEILRRELPLDLVWLVKNPDTPMPKKIRKVPFNTIDACYELSTAKVIITNEMSRLNFEKKENQYFIMTWHGCWRTKLVNFDMGEKATPQLINAINASNAITNLMIAGSEEDFGDIRRAFGYNGEVIRSGLPRQDIFFKPHDDIVAKVKKSLNIPQETKVILYAPTFRDLYSQPLDVYQFDFQKLLDVLKKKFGGDWILLTRLHPVLAQSGISKKIFPTSKNIIDVTNYPDVQELILISDAGLSDYSGVIYDFMISKKSMFILAKDLEWYCEYRGPHQNIFDMPIDINETETDLFNYIENSDPENIRQQVQTFLENTHPYGWTGDASEKVVDKICAVMKN